MKNIKLSNNFWLSELVKSETADRYDIDNFPKDQFIVDKLALVAQNILQPCRDHFDIPFSPNSGYRNLEVNKLVGSKPTSQHPKGEAVDFEIPGIANYDLAFWIFENLEFDQLILEFAKRGVPSAGWVHCSYVSKEKNRKETISIVKGEGVLPGLVR